MHPIHPVILSKGMSNNPLLDARSMWGSVEMARAGQSCSCGPSRGTDVHNRIRGSSRRVPFNALRCEVDLLGDWPPLRPSLFATHL